MINVSWTDTDMPWEFWKTLLNKEEHLFHSDEQCPCNAFGDIRRKVHGKYNDA